MGVYRKIISYINPFMAYPIFSNIFSIVYTFFFIKDTVCSFLWKLWIIELRKYVKKLVFLKQIKKKTYLKLFI